MTQADHRTQLDEQLRAIEEAARAIDAGEAPLPAAGRIAAALAAVFQAEGTAPSLLSRAGGTYARLASSVPKPPYPQNLFLPVVQVTLQMGGGGGFVRQCAPV